MERMVFRIGVPALMVLALAVALDDRGAPAPAATAAERPSHAGELARSSAEVETQEQRALDQPGSWVAHEQAAQARLLRARLSGDLGDYRKAERHVERAFEVAPAGAGPFLVRAQVNMGFHRFDAIEADLRAAERAVLVDDPVRAAILGLRADAAMQAGRLDEALDGFRRAVELDPGFATWSRLALAQSRRGDRAAAEASYRRALDAYHGTYVFPRAWVFQQLGIMSLEAERFEQARAHFERAERSLPGWPVTQALFARLAGGQDVHAHGHASAHAHRHGERGAHTHDEPSGHGRE